MATKKKPVKKLVGQESDTTWNLLLRMMLERDRFYETTRLTTQAEVDERKRYEAVRNKLSAALQTGLQLSPVPPARLPAVIPPGLDLVIA
jgi:hypothetical protein